MIGLDAEARPEGSATAPGSSPVGLGRRELFATTVFLGLAFGFLELLLLCLRVWLQDHGFFLRSRHFVWMVPTSALILFVAMGAALVPLSAPFGARGRRVALGACVFLGCLGQFMLVRGLNSIACGLLAGGIAFRAGPWLEARPEGLRRWVRRGLPTLAAALVIVASASVLRDVWASVQRRGSVEATAGVDRNVVLIVLDTVRADRLSLYGYERGTTPNLKRLAERGVRFNQARAAASWTLPSHAAMFTGRWPSELGVERRGWLDDVHPTLAERLRDSGWTTAGFVANPFFCGWESGLARGFQFYDDYSVTLGEVVRSSSVGWFLARGERRLRFLLGLGVDSGAARDVDLDFSRKDAREVGREFLSWLSRNGPRPFFAFLNFFDAHDPYLLPAGVVPRFRSQPLSDAELVLLRDWGRLDKTRLEPDEVRLAAGAYDECLAELDHQIGALLDALEARGVLDQTLLILTSDHGEQFGEHDRFGHGLSLYDEETRVPLLIALPGRVPAGLSVDEPVSLADLPATVFDLLGLSAEPPFPGGSLASTWEGAPAAVSPAFSELRGRIDSGAIQKERDRARSWQSIVADHFAYVRRGDGREMLYNLAADPGQTLNLVADPARATTLESRRADLAASARALGRHRP